MFRDKSKPLFLYVITQNTQKRTQILIVSKSIMEEIYPTPQV